VLLILSSMALHVVWDSLSALTGNAAWAVGLYVPLSIVNLAVFLFVYHRTVRRERDWARVLLAPEVDRGVISASELDAAIGRRKDRRHFIKAQPHHRSARHVLEATMDLADAVTGSNGIQSPAVDHTRSEVARLRAPG
jgi:hypothetical protein